MLKSFLIAIAAGGLLALSACGLGDGSVDSCATALYGTFEGGEDGVGTIHGVLSIDDETAEGRLRLVFFDADETPEDLTDNADREVQVMVNPNGELSPISFGALQVTGDMDLDTCKISGDWDLFMGTETGTFEVGRYESFGF